MLNCRCQKTLELVTGLPHCFDRTKAVLRLLRGQEAHEGGQRTPGRCWGHPAGGAATVAVLWGDLPLLTRTEACCQLIIISAIALWKSFFLQVFPFPWVTLTSPRGRGPGQHQSGTRHLPPPAVRRASLRPFRPVRSCAVRCAWAGGPASPRLSARPPHWATRPAGPAPAPLRKHAGDSPQSHSVLTFDKRSLAFPCSNMLSLNI